MERANGAFCVVGDYEITAVLRGLKAFQPVWNLKI